MFNKFTFAVPAAALLLSVTGAANAVVVLGVYNTGVSATGGALAAGDGQIDPHYLVASSTEIGVLPGTNARTYYNPAYLTDGPLSRIVNATGNANGTPNSTTTFATTFSLAGFNPATATLSGQTLFDDSGEIFLNGTQIASTITGFNTLTTFGTSANIFNAGLNTLTFVLHNVGGPEAFQVAGLTVTAGAVPEPATWGMMLAGFSMVGLGMRRRTRNVVAA